MIDLEKQLKKLVTVLGVIIGVMLSVPLATAQGGAVQRPIDDFLSTQGKYCIDDGAGGCLLFVPPDPNFLGWNSELDDTPILFAGVDYAGLTNAYANGKKPQIQGTVTERPLKDGRAEVTVLLHTKNANLWVIELDLTGNILDQIANGPTLFGHRPADVLNGESQALGDSILHVVFINSAMGAALPDLIDINTNNPKLLKFVRFSTNARGLLTSEFGVAEGTPGKCTISQTGLSSTKGKGVALVDGFPVENINLSVVGR